MSPLSKKALQLIGIRLLVISTLALLFGLMQLLPEPRSPGTLSGGEIPVPFEIADGSVFFLNNPTYRYVATTFGAVFILSLLWLALHKPLSPFPRVHIHLQLLGDNLVITSLVSFFGGISSPFSILYLVIISTSAALLYRRGSLLVASESFILYSVTLILTYFNIVSIPHSPFYSPISQFSQLQNNIFTHFLAFYAIALLTTYLAEGVTRAEKALVRRLERYADLEIEHHDVIESIPSGVLTTDQNGIIASINQSGAQILRRDPEELTSVPITETGLVSAEKWQGIATQGESKVRDEAEVSVYELVIPIGFTVSPLLDTRGLQRGFLFIFQDLSKWRKMQRQLRIRDRMAAIGELSAGIAHEIGNPLAAISGSVQVLKNNPDISSQHHKLLQIVVKESLRLDRIIKGFLEYARPEVAEFSDFDVALALLENCELLRNSQELKEEHHLIVAIDPKSAILHGNSDGVVQVFWNLVRNALKAMPDGGTLTVAGTQEKGYYRFEIMDTGYGMTEEEQANVFHPFKSFFDDGFGIGMAVVYRVIEEHQAEIIVRSALGQGTEISINFPYSTKIS